MKKMMLSALFVAFGTTAILANTIKSSTTEMVSFIQDEKAPVKLEELPDAVKATLAGEKYSDWTPTGAFVVTPEEGAKHFEVVLKNSEDEVAVLKISEDGKEIPVEVVVEN